MLRLLLFFYIFFICSQNIQAQIKSTQLDYWECYGLEILFTEKVGTKKMKCGLGFLEQKKSTLYKIQVKEIIFDRDTMVYNSDELLEVEYIALDHKEQIIINNSYYLLAGNSSMDFYLIGYRIFSQDFSDSIVLPIGPSIIQGKEVCYELSIFDRIRLLFGATRSKIYTKKRIEKNSNKFYKLISST